MEYVALRAAGPSRRFHIKKDYTIWFYGDY